jgi:hypothetical protein
LEGNNIEMNNEPYVLTVEPIAMERCFLVADILAEIYNQEHLEYGLIGLATQANPFHVVATPLLPRQQISYCSVHVRGNDVFRIRREMDILSKRMGQPLVPITFIHRHPGACGMSSIDSEFLRVFIDQVSAVYTLEDRREVGPEELDCHCIRIRQKSQRHSMHRPARIEYSVCFSLVVNRRREISIDAVRKQWCPFCHKPSVKFVDSKLDINTKLYIADNERDKLKKHLEVEIEAKVIFDRKLSTIGKN